MVSRARASSNRFAAQLVRLTVHKRFNSERLLDIGQHLGGTAEGICENHCGHRPFLISRSAGETGPITRAGTFLRRCATLAPYQEAQLGEVKITAQTVSALVGRAMAAEADGSLRLEPELAHTLWELKKSADLVLADMGAHPDLAVPTIKLSTEVAAHLDDIRRDLDGGAYATPVTILRAETIFDDGA
jgi:hypothetical protein